MKSTASFFSKMAFLSLVALLFACEPEVQISTAELESYDAPDGTIDIASFEGLLFARTDEGIWVHDDAGWSFDALFPSYDGFYIAQTVAGTRLCVKIRGDGPGPDPRRGRRLKCRERHGWEEPSGEPESTRSVVSWGLREESVLSDGTCTESYWVSQAGPYEDVLVGGTPPDIVPHSGGAAVVNERVAIWQDTICTRTGSSGEGHFFSSDVCIRERGEVIVRAPHEGQVMRTRIAAGPATSPGSLWFRGSAAEADGNVWILAELEDGDLRILRLPL